MMRSTLLIFLLNTFFCFSQTDTIQLYYDINSFNASAEELEKLQVADDWLKVSIISYTDYLGSEAYNQKLSERRARAARSRLIQRGLSSEQLNIVEGRGITGGTLESRYGIRTNRRTDIVIWKEKTVSTNELLEESNSIIERNGETEESSLIEQIETTQVGSNLVLKNLSFVGGRHYLLEESLPTLDTLVSLMMNRPNLKIAIEGHICCQEVFDDGFDFDTGTRTLSVERAKYIYTHLIEQGISKDRLSYKGYGRKYPIYEQELNEYQKQANRRVEIKVIEK